MHDDRLRNGTALGEHLARLREVSHLINEDLDLDTVLQGILDSARWLVSARYGFITVLDESGQVRNTYGSGIAPGDDASSWVLPEATRAFESSGGFADYLLIPDFRGSLSSLDPTELSHLSPLTSGTSLLASPVFHHGQLLGAIYLVDKEGEEEFSDEDGETLFILASHAAMAIANARLETEAQQVRGELRAIEDTSSVDEMERLHTEFLGMVSHELRTPLTSIKGSVTTLLNRLSGLDIVEATEFLRIIDSQTDSMDVLISDLLDVARIETGTLSVAPEPTDVALLLEEARNAFLSGTVKNMLHISVPRGIPWVIADRLRIVQVLNNLISNAARHSDEESSIEVFAERRGQWVEVSVSESGNGVSADRVPHLLRRYPEVEGEGEGSVPWKPGLGLSICKGIVEAHGGRIWADSGGSGKRARFTFSIPVVEEVWTGATVVPATLPALIPKEVGKNQVRVLAVDDDPQSLRYIRDALIKAGYEAIVTGDPEEAAGLADRADPHLILLDMLLPGTDGLELMEKVLEKSDVPVIFLSVYGQEETIAKALDAGAVDYVVKPFSPTELTARIRAALRGQSALEPQEPYRQGELEIDYAERIVTIGGRRCQLTGIEYRLLAELSANAGRVLTYEHLLRRVWGVPGDSDVRPMRTIVSNLRRKLGDDADNPTYVFTEPRIGYRMG